LHVHDLPEQNSQAAAKRTPTPARLASYMAASAA
jgi:hypothetical protein